MIFYYHIKYVKRRKGEIYCLNIDIEEIDRKECIENKWVL